ncbi:winged helix-turn-helix domain-containing protein [Vibrio satsumensis]|uniref:winged helix-turn-helix domain-containing protein n=1 Tax=Vibrio TaxID=662 RepID=UPI00255BC1B6|nr:winged helix-turn-helix domain-containing protein [Vibrio sp. TMPB1044]MDL5029017.1 winged helix-turn-helix domain-containing protein [Vibrio sp. TMPB1044]MDN5209145.1 winged helix-turn-helix domain-containing protein [Vibrio sp. TMPB1044]
MTHTINLNGLTLDIDARTITNSQGNKITLRPHLLAVLCLLIENIGRPVSREHIVDVCWDGHLSSPHALANVVYNLRNVFARLRTPNVQIITISKFGYVLSIEPT